MQGPRELLRPGRPQQVVPARAEGGPTGRALPRSPSVHARPGRAGCKFEGPLCPPASGPGLAHPQSRTVRCGTRSSASARTPASTGPRPLSATCRERSCQCGPGVWRSSGGEWGEERKSPSRTRLALCGCRQVSAHSAAGETRDAPGPMRRCSCWRRRAHLPDTDTVRASVSELKRTWIHPVHAERERCGQTGAES